jgi:hypothetical protein
MKNIEIQRITFTMNDLRCLEEVERVFFLQTGGLLQEVISLQKYTYMSSHGSENQLERVAENSQAMYFCRLLASTLFEAWKALGANDRFRSVRARIKPSLGTTSLSALDKLESYFSVSNTFCEKIRNNLSHHYNFGSIRTMAREWPQQEPLEIALAEHHANCRYIASDVMMNYSIFGIKNPVEGANAFLAEIMEVAREFVEYASDCMSILLTRVVKETGLKGTAEHLDVPTIHECRLRYFMADDKI